MQDRNLAFRRRARSLPSDHRNDELHLFSCISSTMIIWRCAFSAQGPVRREDLAFNGTAFACTEYFRYRVALDVRVCTAMRSTTDYCVEFEVPAAVAASSFRNFKFKAALESWSC